MGIYTEVTGTVSIPESAHFSLGKHIESEFGEGVDNHIQPISNSNGFFVIKFWFYLDRDGVDAADAVARFVKGIPGHKDIEAIIRYVD